MAKPAKKLSKPTPRATTAKRAKPARSITGAQFCEDTGLSRQRLSRFVTIGVVPRSDDRTFPMPEARHALIAHLSEVAAGRGGGGAQADLSRERALLARSQREGHELKNAIARNEYLLADDVERRWGDMCAVIRGGVLAIPSRLPTRLPHLTRADLAAIDDELRDVLHAIADKIDARGESEKAGK